MAVTNKVLEQRRKQRETAERLKKEVMGMSDMIVRLDGKYRTKSGLNVDLKQQRPDTFLYPFVGEIQTGNGFFIGHWTYKGTFHERDMSGYDLIEITENEKPMTTETEFKVGDQCTVGGKSARVICVDLRGDYPVIAAIDCPEKKSELTHSFTFDGRSSLKGSITLIKSKPRIKGKRFVLLDPDNGIAGFFPTRAECEARLRTYHWERRLRFAITEYSYDVAEGEGL
jgi:hypothetical protein